MKQHHALTRRSRFLSCLEALEQSRDFVIGRATKYTSEIDTVDMDSLTPFATHAIYQAATMHHRLVQENGGSTSYGMKDIPDVLDRMLKSFGQRWRVAGKHCSSCIERILPWLTFKAQLHCQLHGFS